ncbi:MAG: hypothetical protein ACXW2E_00070 [Nitrososphaeraceae archaeon]
MDRERIRDLVTRKDGKLNSAVLRQDWFLTSIEYETILSFTSFLPSSVNIKERIWCYLNNIVSVQQCIVCNTPAVFLPQFGKGYSQTCSSSKCNQNQLTGLKR